MINIPKHIAIIMDGNGRWAQNRNLPRPCGHVEGEKTLRRICTAADELGVKILTVFAFSTENWSRDREEVDKIMYVLKEFFEFCKEFASLSGYVIRVIGDRSKLSEDLNKAIDDAISSTEYNKGLVVQIAVNYGGKDEIVRAVNRLIKENVSFVNESDIESHLDTMGMDSPDLLIRTGGEIRVSNFMIWQLAYAEFYFTDVLWPDFDKDELVRAIEYYNRKERRYGGIIKK